MKVESDSHRKVSQIITPAVQIRPPANTNATARGSGIRLLSGAPAPAATRKSTASLVRVLTSSNFIVLPFLPFPACFFLHLSGGGKKQGGTVKGTERRPEEGGRA